MGNWSQHSEEWEKQHAKKVIDNANAARIEFEKKPWAYKVIVRASGSISYYWSLLKIQVRMFFDREYSKLAYSPTYRVVMVGATPHSTTGTGQSGSLLAELENHPDKYPRTIALRTEEGTLKITKSGFRKALEKLKEENYIAA